MYFSLDVSSRNVI